jgi:hypothetical protein
MKTKQRQLDSQRVVNQKQSLYCNARLSERYHQSLQQGNCKLTLNQNSVYLPDQTQ